MNFFNVFRELKVQPLQLSTVHWCVGVRGSEFRVHSSIQNTVSLLGENLWSRWDLDDVVFLLMSRYITVEESYNFTLYTDFIYIACDIVYYNFALYTWGEKWLEVHGPQRSPEQLWIITWISSKWVKAMFK